MILTSGTYTQANHFRFFDSDFLQVYWRKTFQFAVHLKNLHVLITCPPTM